MVIDARLVAPATARNRDPILEVLRRHMPSRGLVLEIASGSGEHIAHFAQALGPHLQFQPSDPDVGARASTDAWVNALGVGNILPAIALDASAQHWPIDEADAVICINMVHIAPWEAAVGLIRGSAKLLRSGGVLFLYGPYRRCGEHTSPSNEAFDRSLRTQNREWGVRDLERLVALAEESGFAQPMVKEMPANNLCLIFAGRERVLT
jgi:SAM-dependent methyltransferase